MPKFIFTKARKVGLFVLFGTLGGVVLLVAIGGFILLASNYDTVKIRQGVAVVWVFIGFLAGFGALGLYLMIGVPLQVVRFRVVTDKSGVTVNRKFIPWNAIVDVTEFEMGEGIAKSNYLIIRHASGRLKIPGSLQDYDELKHEIRDATGKDF